MASRHIQRDHSVGAPSFDRLDYNFADPAQANRSWADMVANLNPHGAAVNRKLAITHLDLPPEPVTTVSFQDERKIVTHTNAPALPHQNNVARPKASSPSGPRRRVVGDIRVKPASIFVDEE